LAQRFAAVVLISDKDALPALTHARTAGLARAPVAVAIRGSVDAMTSAQLVAAGAMLCFGTPITRASLDELARVAGNLRTPLEVNIASRLIIDPVDQRILRGRCSVRLTPREFALLYALVEHHGTPVASTRLYKLVWGDQSSSGPNRVLALFIHLLRQKLERVGLVDSLTSLRGYGYQFGQSVSRAEA
jgi:DNA-binding response OmpR family regulator